MRSRTAFLGAALFLFVSAACGAAVVVVGPLLQEYEVKPGSAYEGSIVVQNPSDTAQEVKLYQTDYFHWADGRASYGDPAGELPRSNAKWITVAPQRVTIPAGESMTIAYTIQVPDNASLTGTYWSVIMVEPIDVSSPESASADPREVTLAIRQVFRYAIQVATTFGATGSVQLRFSDLKLDLTDSGRRLQIDLENTGERMFRATVWADIYDSNGQYVGRFDAGQRRLYPGNSTRFTADITSIAEANYKALILADCEGDNIFGANVNLVLRP